MRTTRTTTIKPHTKSHRQRNTISNRQSSNNRTWPTHIDNRRSRRRPHIRRSPTSHRHRPTTQPIRHPLQRNVRTRPGAHLVAVRSRIGDVIPGAPPPGYVGCTLPLRRLYLPLGGPTCTLPHGTPVRVSPLKSTVTDGGIHPRVSARVE